MFTSKFDNLCQSVVFLANKVSGLKQVLSKEISPKISVSGFMGYLKGKSSLMIYEKWSNMKHEGKGMKACFQSPTSGFSPSVCQSAKERSEDKYRYRNREFWCRGYYVDTVGKDATRIAKYIQNQLKEDEELCQLELDFNDPFKGSK